MKLFIPTYCPLCSRILKVQQEDNNESILDCFNPEGDCFWAGICPDVEESFVSAVYRRNPRVLFIFYENYFRISPGHLRDQHIPYGKIKEIDFASKESLQKVFSYGEKLLLL